MLLKEIFAILASGAVAAGGMTSSNPPHHVVIQAGKIPEKASDRAYNTTMQHFACGTTHKNASAHFNHTVAQMHAAQLANASAGGSGGSGAARARFARRSVPQNLSVPLYMHIVTQESNANSITQQMVSAQFAELNNAYNPLGISFTLQGTTFTANDAWAQGGTTDLDTAMKTALRRGTYSTLNLYFQTDLAGGILGQCTLPTTVSSEPSSYVGDGCNVAAGTMPGGPIYGYNEGKTAVHETGHWLGMLHTFEGYSCTGPGDYISDTPPESQSTSGCPTNPWKNTCPRKSKAVGGDPIHNYMDYSIDSCYTRFTPGQQQRMFSMWAQYRQAFVAGSNGSDGASGSGASSSSSSAADRKHRAKSRGKGKGKGKGKGQSKRSFLAGFGGMRA